LDTCVKINETFTQQYDGRSSNLSQNKYQQQFIEAGVSPNTAEAIDSTQNKVGNKGDDKMVEVQNKINNKSTTSSSNLSSSTTSCNDQEILQRNGFSWCNRGKRTGIEISEEIAQVNSININNNIFNYLIDSLRIDEHDSEGNVGSDRDCDKSKKAEIPEGVTHRQRKPRAWPGYSPISTLNERDCIHRNWDELTHIRETRAIESRWRKYNQRRFNYYVNSITFEHEAINAQDLKQAELRASTATLSVRTEGRATGELLQLGKRTAKECSNKEEVPARAAEQAGAHQADRSGRTTHHGLVGKVNPDDATWTTSNTSFSTSTMSQTSAEIAANSAREAQVELNKVEKRRRRGHDVEDHPQAHNGGSTDDDVSKISSVKMSSELSKLEFLLRKDFLNKALLVERQEALRDRSPYKGVGYSSVINRYQKSNLGLQRERYDNNINKRMIKQNKKELKLRQIYLSQPKYDEADANYQVFERDNTSVRMMTLSAKEFDELKQKIDTDNQPRRVEERITYSAVDSGAGKTVAAKDTYLNNYTKSYMKFQGFNHSVSTAQGVGTMSGSTQTISGKYITLNFPETHTVKEVTNDLISISSMVKENYEFFFSDKNPSYMNTPDGHKLPLIAMGGLYWLKWYKRTLVEPTRHGQKRHDSKKRKSTPSTSTSSNQYPAAAQVVSPNGMHIDEFDPGGKTSAVEEIDIEKADVPPATQMIKTPYSHLYPLKYIEEMIGHVDRLNQQNSFEIDDDTAVSNFKCEECCKINSLQVCKEVKQGYSDEPMRCFKANCDKQLVIDLELHHRRMAHFNRDYLIKQQKQGGLGNVTLVGVKSHNCDTCKTVKITRNNPPNQREDKPVATKPFEQVWSDVKGPMKSDFYGNKYMVTFNDEFSRYSTVYFCKTKDEVAARFEDFIIWVEKQKFKINMLTSDNGGEYDGKEFRAVCDIYRIQQQFTAFYTSAQNGISERINRTYCESTTAALHDAALGHQWWSLAVKHICWLRNRLYHRSLDIKDSKLSRSPYEVMRGRRPRDLMLAKVFGCDAWYLDHNRDKSELKPRGIRGVFVGVAHDSKGWLIMDPVTKHIKASYHCTFNEDFNDRRCALSGLRLSMRQKAKRPKHVIDWFDCFEKETREEFFCETDPDFGTGAGPKIEYENDFDTSLRMHIADQDEAATVGAPTGRKAEAPKAAAADDGSASSDHDIDGESDSNFSSHDDDGSDEEVDKSAPTPIAPRTLRSGKTSTPEVESDLRHFDPADEEEVFPYPANAKVRDCIPVRPSGLAKGQVFTPDGNLTTWIKFALKHDWKISLDVKNPKTRGSKSRPRYDTYKFAKTLSEMIKFGAKFQDIGYDYVRGYITFDTNSNITVKELAELTKEKESETSPQSEEGTYNIINGLYTSEDIAREEFLRIGEDYLESLGHNQQRLVRDALGMTTLTNFAHICAHNILFVDPVSVDEALSGEYADEWRAAMDEEIANLIKFKCFVRVPKQTAQEHGKLMQSRWIFKTKRNSDSSFQRFRARLVAKGFLQTESVDYYETYSPVFSYTSFRTVMALATSRDMRIDQWDLKNAYLQQPIDVGHMYMACPQGYSAMMDDGVTPAAMHCLGSIYGMKQSGRLLHLRLKKFLKDNGYQQLISDQCIYKRGNGYDEEFVCCYVDDIIVLTHRNNEDKRTEFNTMLRNEFEVSPWTSGECDWILNIAVTRDWEKGTMHLSQEAAVIKLAKKFDLANEIPMKGSSVPMDPNIRLSKPNEDNIISSKRFDYMSAVGGLLYLSMTTRPDIAYSVGVLSRYMSCPGQEQVTAAKKIISYLYQTRKFGIRYSRSDQEESMGAPHQRDHPTLYVHANKSKIAIQGSVDNKEKMNLDSNVMASTYVDADLAGDTDTMKSTTGFIILLFGGIVAYMSKLQSTVALSTAEAETNAAVEAVKQLSHIRLLLTELGISQDFPTTVYEDNNAVMELIKSGESSKRMKHYLIKFHYLIEKKEDGTFKLVKVITTEQLADTFTKALPFPAFNKYRNWMGIIPPSDDMSKASIASRADFAR